MPGNTVLPEHGGMIITRGLQEWACLLPQDLPFTTAQRLLGWQTQEPEILSATELRQLVRKHGQVIRTAEAAEVEALLARPDLKGLKPQLVPAQTPRRQAAWPEELNAAVEAALAAIDSVVLIIHGLDLFVQGSIRHLPRADGPFAPSIVPTTRDP